MDQRLDMDFVEMGCDAFREVRHLFTGRHMDMVIDSVLLANTPGRFWTLDPGDREFFSLLWD